MICVNLDKPISPLEAAQKGKLKLYLKRYLISCLPPPDADPKRGGGRFPNLAGFCSYLGCGFSQLEAFRLAYPDEWDWLNAVMEDEALNNSALLSPTVLNAYLKRRLGYTDKSDSVSGADCGEMRVIFEHDIGEDGG